MRLAILSAFWLAGSGAGAERPEIDDLKWIHHDADRISSLTVVPAECGAVSAEAEHAYAIRLGRVAFRSPVLLGGLAARVGLSCNSCHLNGHDNPDFFIAGVSSDAGTADVTGSVFSTARDDHVFNPVPIPSLVDAAASAPFGSVLPAEDLATFVRAAVVDEFQGQPPPKSIADALLAYIQSLTATACPDPATVAITFESDAVELNETFAVLLASLDRRDEHAAEFALLSLRAALGRVYRRFPETVSVREELLELSISLSAQRPGLSLRLGTSTGRPILAALRQRQEALIQKLAQKSEESYYDPARLRRALAPGRPAGS